jgi:hypothetical protein
MISPALTYITAKQQITERQRAPAQHRAVRPIADPRRPDADAGRVALRRLRPRESR